MDRLIPLGYWAAVALALFLTLGALTAEAGERPERRSRTVTLERLEDIPRYRPACPRVGRYTRDLGNCRRAWERDRPVIRLQPKGETRRRNIVR